MAGTAGMAVAMIRADITNRATAFRRKTSARVPLRGNSLVASGIKMTLSGIRIIRSKTGINVSRNHPEHVLSIRSFPTDIFPK